MSHDIPIVRMRAEGGDGDGSRDDLDGSEMPLVMEQDLEQAKSARCTGPTNHTPVSPVNMTHSQDKRHYQLYQQAVAEVDPARRKEISHELQQLDFEEGATIIAAHPNYTGAYAANVGGFYPANITGGTVAAGYFDKLGFVA